MLSKNIMFVIVFNFKLRIQQRKSSHTTLNSYTLNIGLCIKPLSHLYKRNIVSLDDKQHAKEKKKQ